MEYLEQGGSIIILAETPDPPPSVNYKHPTGEDLSPGAVKCG